MIINGNKIAEEILGELKKQPRPEKFLAAVLVGSDPSSLSFVRQKEKNAGILGIDFKVYEFPESVGERELSGEILKIAETRDCGGIVVQLPLPAHINRDEIIAAIPPGKDVDNLTGRASVLAPAVGVVEEIIRNLKLEIRNSRVAVVGLGPLVGGPVAGWLEGKCAGLQTLESGDDLGILKEADLIISGAGQAGLIKPEMLKSGAVVVDFGYGAKDGRASGDFDASALKPTTYNLPLITYTPTPGGTGPILVAKLFENFYKLTTL